MRAEGLLESVEQPTKYMIDSIRSKEAEIESLRSAQHRLTAKTGALERACRFVILLLALPTFFAVTSTVGATRFFLAGGGGIALRSGAAVDPDHH